MERPAVRAGLVLATSVALLLLLHWMAPLQWPTVLFYTSVVLLLISLTSLVQPLRWLWIANRIDALTLCIASALLGFSALTWPAALQHPKAYVSTLDEFMPEYHFSEVHTERIAADAGRAALAVEQTTFDEIAGLRTLMGLRGLVMGGAAGTGGARPILSAMQQPGSGFFEITRTNEEWVFGMVGRPWTNERPPPVTGDTFLEFNEPGYVKVAFNLRLVAGGLSTETRVLATNAEARQMFGRYWRIIYPGSGLIRRGWLSAIRARAEHP